MKTLIIFFFAAAFISLINAHGLYTVHSHSGSWCDYETKLGRVNIQVIKNNEKYDRYLKFKMTLVDNDKKEYPAECYIGENEQTNDKSFIAYCLFNPTSYDTNLYYKKDTLVKTEGLDDIKIEDDFYVIAQKCESSGAIIEKDYNNIKLTFRQINRFVFNLIDSQITFKLFVITTESLPKGKAITLFLYLILKDGTVEPNLTKAQCTLDETVNPRNRRIQADFTCKINGLKKQYVTFILNRSDDIVGIPREETLLNPIKTAEAIKKGNLTDYSKGENKNKTIPLFIPSFVNGTTCPEEGVFKIVGTLNETVDNLTEFILPISYPQNFTSKCYIENTEEGEGEINCIMGQKFEGKSLIFEQQIIRNGSEELFILENIQSEQMKCYNANITIDYKWVQVINETYDIDEADEKSNLNISFRQLHSFDFKDRLIKFFFYGLTTKPLIKGKIIYLFVNLILEDDTVDPALSEAICTLDESVNSTVDQEQVQADFSCNITLNETKKYKSFRLNHTNHVVGIPKNETLLNPVKTDEAIEKENLTDYSKKENKNKCPPLFIPELIDGTSCSEEGEFKITGSLKTEIEKDIEFTLPMTYPPNYTSNCTMVKTAPGKGEINCVVEKELLGKPLIFEQQTIRDGLNEFLTLKRIKSTNYLYCGNLDIRENENKEKALNRTKIPITFRQIKEFKYAPGEITFMLFVLVTQHLKPKEEIRVFVNLIKENGEKEDEPTEVVCTLEKEVSPEEGKSVQGDFKCTKAVKEKYNSLRLNSSETMTGIPSDEVLLDPVLTEKAIEDQTIIDFSIKDNREKIPPTFTYKKIIESSCRTDGKFIIEGNVTQVIRSDNKFNIPLIYPEGASIQCHFDKDEAESNKIICQTDNDIDNKKIMTEQVIIKDGNEELFNLGSFSSEKKITCLNGLLLEKQKKKDIKISFRQVSHLKHNGKNGFEFIFISLISDKKPVEPIKMKVLVLIDGKKKEKEAICTLQNNVDPKQGEQVQGDFKCEVIVEEEEYPKIDFYKVETIQISPENEEISGISELDNNQTSPYATDIAINETKNNNDTNSTVLSECIDYFEVKSKIPPSLEISSVDEDNSLKEKGKIRLTGKFSHDINEKMEFELPLTYPPTKLKCKVVKAKANQEVVIICKVQKEFKLAKTFVFEPRMIKKRHKEMVFIKSNSFPFSYPISCENYNNIRYERIKKRHNKKVSYLQLTKFKPIGKKVNFFLALTKKHKEPFDDRIYLKTKVIRMKQRLNNLRSLQDTVISNEDLTITCDLNGESLTAAGYNCLSTKEAQNEPSEIKIVTDDIDDIAGFPDDADPSEFNYANDYSNKDNLEIVDKLPNVTIDSIDGSNCEENGEYTIKGKYDNGDLKDASNVEIPFGYPDSSGLCDIKVDNKDVTMKCQNKEKFDNSKILFETITVQDSEGKDIFKLNEYSDNQASFACAISANSVPTASTVPSNPTDSEDPKDSSKTNTSEPINVYNTNFLSRKTSSSGLSAGSIVAIVLSLVALLIAIAIIIAIAKFGLCSKKSNIPNKSIDSMGSNNNLSYNPKN